MTIRNVLVFPGGTEIGLEIFQALHLCKDIRLFSAGTESSNHASCVFARHFTLPSIHDQSWITALNRVVEEQAIHYIIPAYDDIIVALSQNSGMIKAAILSSPFETCRITRSKSKTYQLMQGVVPIPATYTTPGDVKTYPVFVKPDQGQGAEHAYRIEGESQLCELLNSWSNKGTPLISEYLPGEEYTVDCFTDRERGLLFCSGRVRVRVRAGIAMNSRRINNPIFKQYAEKISKKLLFYGAWFFQLKKDGEGVYKLMEIAPRIAGTMALHRVMGVNFPLLSIYEAERMPVSILINEIDIEIDRALVSRYRHALSYSSVYVDLDDTLILNEYVNVKLIAFLYQCVNHGKQIYLVTRHSLDVHETLQKHRISSKLFEQIFHLKEMESKAAIIGDKASIFIDDSFSERWAVHHGAGIPTFDCSMLEMLMDVRR